MPLYSLSPTSLGVLASICWRTVSDPSLTSMNKVGIEQSEEVLVPQVKLMLKDPAEVEQSSFGLSAESGETH